VTLKRYWARLSGTDHLSPGLSLVPAVAKEEKWCWCCSRTALSSFQLFLAMLRAGTQTWHEPRLLTYILVFRVSMKQALDWGEHHKHLVSQTHSRGVGLLSMSMCLCLKSLRRQQNVKCQKPLAIQHKEVEENWWSYIRCAHVTPVVLTSQCREKYRVLNQHHFL